MDVGDIKDRRRLVFRFVFAPLLLQIIAGLVASMWFDEVLLAIFPVVVLILCAKISLAWCFTGIIGSVVYFVWLAVASMQWLGYGLAVLWALRRGKLRTVVVALVLFHIAAVGAAAYVMYGVCDHGGDRAPMNVLY